jgi:H+/Cl- antiporter ClcA
MQVAVAELIQHPCQPADKAVADKATAAQAAQTWAVAAAAVLVMELTGVPVALEWLLFGTLTQSQLLRQLQVRPQLPLPVDIEYINLPAVEQLRFKWILQHDNYKKNKTV